MRDLDPRSCARPYCGLQPRNVSSEARPKLIEARTTAAGAYVLREGRVVGAPPARSARAPSPNLAYKRRPAPTSHNTTMKLADAPAGAPDAPAASAGTPGANPGAPAPPDHCGGPPAGPEPDPKPQYDHHHHHTGHHGHYSHHHHHRRRHEPCMDPSVSHAPDAAGAMPLADGGGRLAWWLFRPPPTTKPAGRVLVIWGAFATARHFDDVAAELRDAHGFEVRCAGACCRRHARAPRACCQRHARAPRARRPGPALQLPTRPRTRTVPGRPPPKSQSTVLRPRRGHYRTQPPTHPYFPHPQVLCYHHRGVAASGPCRLDRPQSSALLAADALALIDHVWGPECAVHLYG